MNCPKCQTRNPEGARFCFNCGSALSQACVNCGTNLQPDARFCHNCGQPVPTPETASASPPASVVAAAGGVQTSGQLQEPAELLQRYIPKELLSKLQAARHSRLMEGERRVVTILFCDVKGSTLAASRLDPEEWAEIINGAFEHMIQPVYRFEGTVARLQGDGLLAFFGAPIAHEDDPQRAVLAGLDIVQASRTYGESVKHRWGIDFAVRVGINTGLVVVGAVGSDLRVEYSALGDAINLASRMEQAAQPGTVLIAEPTYKLVAPLFDFEIVEAVEMKGREAPVKAYRALGRKAEPGSLRGITGLNSPLVGRQAQLDSLWSALKDLVQGRGQIVSVIGEAGLGKSRLITEFSRMVRADPAFDLEWLEGRSLSFETARPFAPFANLFKSFFGIQSSEAGEAQSEQLTRRLDSLFPGRSEEFIPFIATLLDLPLAGEVAERLKYLEPPQLRSIIFAKVAGLIERLLSFRPVVIYLDDLHWADPTSLELLQALLPFTENNPLMIISAFRPHRQDASWGFHEKTGRDYSNCYHIISLDPLDERQSRELVANLLHIENLPDKVRKKILEKAEGNPFFVEELIRSLLDAGLVVRVNGNWQATREIETIVLPDTLVGVITARLDRLDDTARQILQAAAVLGREFSPAVLNGVIETPEQLEPTLIEFQRRELVREKSHEPRRTFTFKHVLVQEAAYNSILLSNRRELHRRAAETLIASDPESVTDISRHLIEARQSARAAPYLVQAGDRAAKAYATAEAITYYNQVIGLQGSLSDLGALRRAYEGLGAALSFANRIPEAQATYQEMLALAELSNDIAMQISALNKLAGVYALYMGRFPEAEQLLARADKLSQQHSEKSGIPETALLRCQMCTFQADFEKVIEHMDEVIQVGQETGDQEFIAMGLEHLSSSLVYLTQFEEAMQKAQEGLRVAREVGDREHEASLLAFTLPIAYIRAGDFATARAALIEGLQIAAKIGALGTQALAAYLLAEMARWQGEYESALAYGQHSLEAALPLEQHTPYMLVPTLGSLGMIYLEISEQFTDKIGEFHLHALRLLESPVAMMTGGTAWADLGLCAITLGDLKVAEEAIQKGLNYPNMFMRLERPRHLAGAALLANARNELDNAVRLAGEARAYAQERGMRHIYPLTTLIEGKVLLARGEIEASLQALEQAEREALLLGMRPIVWQARAAAAEALEVVGQNEQAEEKRAAARAMVEEIAALFQNQDLREAYLRNALGKI